MTPRRPILIGFAALALLAGAGSARAQGPVDTILRRGGDSAVTVALGPTRAQGDFADHLDEILAQAAPDSAAVAPPIPAPADAAAAEPDDGQPPLVAPILSGAAAGAIGLYGGAIVSVILADESNNDIGDWFQILGGAYVGDVILMPLGVHLGNGRKGSFGQDLLASFLGSLAGIGVFAALDGSTPAFLAGMSVQLGTTVFIERKSARQKIAARRAAAP